MTPAVREFRLALAAWRHAKDHAGFAADMDAECRMIAAIRALAESGQDPWAGELWEVTRDSNLKGAA